MAKIKDFEKNAESYDAWFDKHPDYFKLEMEALKKLVPVTGRGIEIGVGTGKFARLLGIKHGIEPSQAMATIAKKRGIKVITGIAENLPLKTETFDYSVFITVICFLDSIKKSFAESFRILKPAGSIVIGFIENGNFLGRKYEQKKESSLFYKKAVFHTTDEVLKTLIETGFSNPKFLQTLFFKNRKLAYQVVKEGYGQGSFVVVRAEKPV